MTIVAIAAIVLGHMVGKLGDTFGKYYVFLFGITISNSMVLIYTHIGITPLRWCVVVNALLSIDIFSILNSRISVESAATLWAAVVLSWCQFIATTNHGVGSVVAGLMGKQSTSWAIQHFEVLSYILLGLCY